MTGHIVKFRYGSDTRKVLLDPTCDTFIKMTRIVHKLFTGCFPEEEELCYKYVDSDGDLVTISNDNEWRLALKEDNLKVYVVPFHCLANMDSCAALHNAMVMPYFDAANVSQQLAMMQSLLMKLIDRLTKNELTEDLHSLNKTGFHDMQLSKANISTRQLKQELYKLGGRLSFIDSNNKSEESTRREPNVHPLEACTGYTKSLSGSTSFVSQMSSKKMSIPTRGLTATRFTPLMSDQYLQQNALVLHDPTATKTPNVISWLPINEIHNFGDCVHLASQLIHQPPEQVLPTQLLKKPSLEIDTRQDIFVASVTSVSTKPSKKIRPSVQEQGEHQPLRERRSPSTVQVPPPGQPLLRNYSSGSRHVRDSQPKVQQRMAGKTKHTTSRPPSPPKPTYSAERSDTPILKRKSSDRLTDSYERYTGMKRFRSEPPTQRLAGCSPPLSIFGPNDAPCCRASHYTVKPVYSSPYLQLERSSPIGHPFNVSFQFAPSTVRSPSPEVSVTARCNNVQALCTYPGESIARIQRVMPFERLFHPRCNSAPQYTCFGIYCPEFPERCTCEVRPSSPLLFPGEMESVECVSTSYSDYPNTRYSRELSPTFLRQPLDPISQNVFNRPMVYRPPSQCDAISDRHVIYPCERYGTRSPRSVDAVNTYCNTRGQSDTLTTYQADYTGDQWQRIQRPTDTVCSQWASPSLAVQPFSVISQPNKAPTTCRGSSRNRSFADYWPSILRRNYGRILNQPLYTTDILCIRHEPVVCQAIRSVHPSPSSPSWYREIRQVTHVPCVEKSTWWTMAHYLPPTLVEPGKWLDDSPLILKGERRGKDLRTYMVSPLDNSCTASVKQCADGSFVVNDTLAPNFNQYVGPIPSAPIERPSMMAICLQQPEHDRQATTVTRGYSQTPSVCLPNRYGIPEICGCQSAKIQNNRGPITAALTRPMSARRLPRLLGCAPPTEVMMPAVPTHEVTRARLFGPVFPDDLCSPDVVVEEVVCRCPIQPWIRSTDIRINSPIDGFLISPCVQSPPETCFCRSHCIPTVTTICEDTSPCRCFTAEKTRSPCRTQKILESTSLVRLPADLSPEVPRRMPSGKTVPKTHRDVKDTDKSKPKPTTRRRSSARTGVKGISSKTSRTSQITPTIDINEWLKMKEIVSNFRSCKCLPRSQDQYCTTSQCPPRPGTNICKCNLEDRAVTCTRSIDFNDRKKLSQIVLNFRSCDCPLPPCQDQCFCTPKFSPSPKTSPYDFELHPKPVAYKFEPEAPKKQYVRCICGSKFDDAARSEVNGNLCPCTPEDLELHPEEISSNCICHVRVKTLPREISSPEKEKTYCTCEFRRIKRVLSLTKDRLSCHLTDREFRVDSGRLQAGFPTKGLGTFEPCGCTLSDRERHPEKFPPECPCHADSEGRLFRASATGSYSTSPEVGRRCICGTTDDPETTKRSCLCTPADRQLHPDEIPPNCKCHQDTQPPGADGATASSTQSGTQPVDSLPSSSSYTLVETTTSKKTTVTRRHSRLTLLDKQHPLCICGENPEDYKLCGCTMFDQNLYPELPSTCRCDEMANPRLSEKSEDVCSCGCVTSYGSGRKNRGPHKPRGRLRKPGAWSFYFPETRRLSGFSDSTEPSYCDCPRTSESSPPCRRGSYAGQQVKYNGSSPNILFPPHPTNPYTEEEVESMTTIQMDTYEVDLFNATTRPKYNGDASIEVMDVTVNIRTTQEEVSDHRMPGSKASSVVPMTQRERRPSEIHPTFPKKPTGKDGSLSPYASQEWPVASTPLTVHSSNIVSETIRQSASSYLPRKQSTSLDMKRQKDQYTHKEGINLRAASSTESTWFETDSGVKLSGSESGHGLGPRRQKQPASTTSQVHDEDSRAGEPATRSRSRCSRGNQPTYIHVRTRSTMRRCHSKNKDFGCGSKHAKKCTPNSSSLGKAGKYQPKIQPQISLQCREAPNDCYFTGERQNRPGSFVEVGAAPCSTYKIHVSTKTFGGARGTTHGHSQNVSQEHLLHETEVSANLNTAPTQTAPETRPGSAKKKSSG
ncbi:hypothetical protein CSKR_104999 [Clonorchis sinensis]|uniref:PB1 domain-containing protein n=1 Tax=Clonorchis sinensis TaxID=79923 RepID=A0A8T1M6J4_CLOSI|nr:hypothetical protein CSKR_104999 [Clonorchis sinensis]